MIVSPLTTTLEDTQQKSDQTSTVFELKGDVLTNEFFAEGLSTMLAGPDEFKNSANKYFPTAMPELNSILKTTISK